MYCQSIDGLLVLTFSRGEIGGNWRPVVKIRRFRVFYVLGDRRWFRSIFPLENVSISYHTKHSTSPTVTGGDSRGKPQRSGGPHPFIQLIQKLLYQRSNSINKCGLGPQKTKGGLKLCKTPLPYCLESMITYQ